jgi:glycosyltransferase involved in cell wall biosynthesis
MISIIIPTYNRSQLISRAVNSILAQSFQQWELVVVDDGSKDNTNEVIKRFLSDPRIRYINKENTGAAHTRNVGVDHASNEWITFLDSDDEAKPNWLEKFVEEINRGGEFISCGLEKYDESGQFLETILPKQNSTNTGGQYTNGGVYFLRKKIFQHLGGFDVKVKSGQHTELYFRIRKYAEENHITSTLINDALVKIHIHGGYRIRTDFSARYDGSLYIYNKHYHYALRSRKMRSLFESMIAYNAFQLKKRNEALKFGLKAFLNKPNKRNLKRFFRYAFKINK